MTAIIDDRGRQYTVKKDDVIYIDKLDNNDSDTVEFDKILFFKNDNDVKIGSPYVKNVKVKAKIVKDVRDDKVIVFKFKRRKNYKRTKGHKQPYTMIKIEEITA